MIEVRRATEDDAERIYPQIRRYETYQIPLELLVMGVRLSDEAWVGEADGEPGALWGWKRPNLLALPIPWLFTTPLVERHKVAFAKRALRVLRDLGPIDGHCDEAFATSERWLRWMGFELGPPEDTIYGTIRRVSWPQ